MLIADEARRRCTFVPVGLLVLGLGLGLGSFAFELAPENDPFVTGLMVLFPLLLLGWFAFGLRHARREGDEIELRSLSGTQRVPAKGSEVALLQGGGHRSPHLDVLLQPAEGPALRLARHELFGIGGAARVARRIAAVLDVRVDEKSVGELEARLGAAVEQRRAGWRWLAGIMAVGAVASVVMVLVADQTMATLVIRCPGGQVREGRATMLDGLEMTTDPGMHVFELHPAEGPAWTQRVELATGQTTVLDCSARPAPATTAAQVRDRQ